MDQGIFEASTTSRVPLLGDSSRSSSTVSTPTNAKSSNNKRAMQKKKLACVECRQQKSKCDANERTPEPCSRCLKKGVPCVLQKDFRRTCKRARNEVIAKKFQELTQSLTSLGSEELLKKLDAKSFKLSDDLNLNKDGGKSLHEGLWSLDSSKESGKRTDAEQTDLRQAILSTKDAMTLAAARSKDEQPTRLDGPITLTPEQLACVPLSLIHI